MARAGELGVATAMLPVLWCVFQVLKSGGNLIAGRTVDRIGSRPMILLGWTLYAVIYLGFAMASAEWQIWMLFVGYAMFYAFTEPAEKTLVANLVGPEQRGLAYGWFNAAVGIGALSASLLFGWLYQTLRSAFLPERLPSGVRVSRSIALSEFIGHKRLLHTVWPNPRPRPLPVLADTALVGEALGMAFQ